MTHGSMAHGSWLKMLNAQWSMLCVLCAVCCVRVACGVSKLSLNRYMAGILLVIILYSTYMLQATRWSSRRAPPATREGAHIRKRRPERSASPAWRAKCAQLLLLLLLLLLVVVVVVVQLLLCEMTLALGRLLAVFVVDETLVQQPERLLLLLLLLRLLLLRLLLRALLRKHLLRMVLANLVARVRVLLLLLLLGHSHLQNAGLAHVEHRPAFVRDARIQQEMAVVTPGRRGAEKALRARRPLVPRAHRSSAWNNLLRGIALVAVCGPPFKVVLRSKPTTTLRI